MKEKNQAIGGVLGRKPSGGKIHVGSSPTSPKEMENAAMKNPQWKVSVV